MEPKVEKSKEIPTLGCTGINILHRTHNPKFYLHNCRITFLGGKYLSFMPAFELGLWNAWILILPFFLMFLTGQIVNKEKFEKPPITNKEKKLSHLYIVTLLTVFVYPIFLPLELGTIWFYTGLVFYSVGMVFCGLAELYFATSSVNKLFTKGVYRISRNPMYLSAFLICVGVGLTCISWVFLLLAGIFIILANSLVSAEERFCLEKYGTPYREYMNRTPRWIGIPKSSKHENS